MHLVLSEVAQDFQDIHKGLTSLTQGQQKQQMNGVLDGVLRGTLMVIGMWICRTEASSEISPDSDSEEI